MEQLLTKIRAVTKVFIQCSHYCPRAQHHNYNARKMPKKTCRIKKTTKKILNDREGEVKNLLACIDILNTVLPHEDCLLLCKNLQNTC